MERKRYWYFITQEDMGDKMTLSPRTPLNMGDGEPKKKRICVAPTVAHCMSAICLYDYDCQHRSTHVYRTIRKVRGHETYDVPDAYFTKEHWLLSKTQFERVDTIGLSRRVRWAEGSRGGSSKADHWDQQRDKQNIVRYLGKRDKRLVCKVESNQRWKP